MRYYIFADNNEIITCNVSQAIKSSDNYYEIKEYFDHINSEYRYNNSYLVADFYTYKPASMFSKNTIVSLDNIDYDDNMPFLIIGEFHYDPDTEKCNIILENGKMDLDKSIRKDMITIKSEGFARTFYNNQSALEAFDKFIEQKCPAQMFIKFKKWNSNKNDNVQMERFVGSTISVMRSRRSSIEKIKLSPSVYEEIKPNRRFYNYNLKEEALV